MKVYKLTTQDGKTYNQTQWGPGVTHETNGEGELCGPGWLHFYYSPELAGLLNPLHADISDPVLWECEAGPARKDDRGLKGGTTKLTTVRLIPLPFFTLNQRVAFGIYCALEVYSTYRFVEWANSWLVGGDRTESAAAAAAALDAAARAAWDAAAGAALAAWDADAAADAAALAADAAALAALEVRAAEADFSFLQRAAEKALKVY